MAELTLGEDFAGRKLGELRGDLPNSAPVTYYPLEIPCEDPGRPSFLKVVAVQIGLTVATGVS